MRMKAAKMGRLHVIIMSYYRMGMRRMIEGQTE